MSPELQVPQTTVVAQVAQVPVQPKPADSASMPAQEYISYMI